MNFKGIIFDLDGTLLDTIMDIGDCLNYVLLRHGYPARTYDEYVSFVCNGSRKLVERAASGVTEAETDIILSEYKKYYSENYSVKTVPYEGVCELVRALKQRGYKLGIYSNKPDGIVKALAEKHFSGCFDCVRGQTETVPVKPSPEGALLTAAEMGVKAEECVFVGDSTEDRLTAVNANMKAVNVSWGYRSGSYLKENGADICVDTVADLERLLQAL